MAKEAAPVSGPDGISHVIGDSRFAGACAVTFL